MRKRSSLKRNEQCLAIQAQKIEHGVMCERKAEEAKVKEESSVQSQEKEVGNLLQPRKEDKMKEHKPSAEGKSNEQVLRQIKWKV